MYLPIYGSPSLSSFPDLKEGPLISTPKDRSNRLPIKHTTIKATLKVIVVAYILFPQRLL